MWQKALEQLATSCCRCGITILEHRAGRIVAVYLICNPDKLQRVWF